MVSSIDTIKYNLTLLNKRNEKVTYQMSSGDALQNGSDDSQKYNKILSINNNVSTYTSILERIQSSESYNKNSDKSVASMKTSMENIIGLLNEAATNQQERVRHAGLREKIMSAEQAAEFIQNGMNVGSEHKRVHETARTLYRL